MSLKSYLKGIVRAIFGRPNPQLVAEIKLSTPSRKLAGKNVIVTGGGRGLGATIAKRFVEEGANVLIAGRNIDALKHTSKEVGCLYHMLDLADIESIKSFIVDADKMLGEIDILVNNAGVSLHEESFLEVSVDGFDRQFYTNLRGPFFLTQKYIARLLKSSQKGNIIFISSETGETVDFRPYGLTKTAVNSLVKGLANCYSKEGIRVNAIAPGVTATEMTGYSSTGNLYCSYNINERVYLPEEIAEIAVGLASDTSGCVSGQIITCNNANTVNPRWR